MNDERALAAFRQVQAAGVPMTFRQFVDEVEAQNASSPRWISEPEVAGRIVRRWRADRRERPRFARLRWRARRAWAALR